MSQIDQIIVFWTITHLVMGACELLIAYSLYCLLPMVSVSKAFHKLFVVGAIVMVFSGVERLIAAFKPWMEMQTIYFEYIALVYLVIAEIYAAFYVLNLNRSSQEQMQRERNIRVVND